MKLNLTVTRAYKVNPNIRFEVFIHKVDGLSDDHKIEAQRDIHQRANDELMEEGFDSVNLSFYLTSIYDHSIFEAFSKVVQKLIPQLPTLENLLNIFVSVIMIRTFRLCLWSKNNHDTISKLSFLEFWNRKSISLWRCFQDLYRYRFISSRYAKLRIMLRHDRRCCWYLVHLWVWYSWYFEYISFFVNPLPYILFPQD